MPVIIMYFCAIVLVFGIFVSLALFCFSKSTYAGKVICIIGAAMVIGGILNLAAKML